MLPAFVIGLREGLETVVIIGATALFLRARQRLDLLGKVWRASAIAAAICVGVALVIRFVEINLPWRRQEQFETVVGLVAVLMVTYMVVWMRRFPKDLQRDSSAAAAAALIGDSGRALILLAFFAVLREGFEIAVFVVATIGMTGSNAWEATGGAVLGVVVALVVGIGVVRGSTRLDVARFFRATALVLVLSAAGIALSTLNTANAAGWVTFGQTPQFDLSWLAPPGSVLSSFTTGMFGLQPYPVLIEVVAWLAYFVPMTAVVLWPRVKQRPAAGPIVDDGPAVVVDQGASPRASSRWLSARMRRTAAWGGSVALLTVALVVYTATSATSAKEAARSIPGGRPLAARHLPLAGNRRSTSHASSHASSPTAVSAAVASPRILFASLHDVVCPSAQRCIAVGEFLPVDKDAARGDPDGDGRATHALVESSDGARWSLLKSPDAGRGGAVLSGVACPTASDCVAVGYYLPALYPLNATAAPASYPLIESYDRRAWHIVASPPVPPNSVLVSVSCPMVSACVAVGYTATDLPGGRTTESTVVETWDGRSWTAAKAPGPANASSGLSSVSCPSASRCVAVGQFAPRSDPGLTHPLIESFDGTTWSKATLPPKVTEDPGILYDVACGSLGHCTAVGNTQTRRLSGSALVLTLTGTTWSTNPAALRQRGDVSVSTVSCASSGGCVASGLSWSSLEAAPDSVLARVDASGWHELSAPPRSAAIEGVACPTPASCVVVGSRPVNLFGNSTTMIARLVGNSWTPQTGPTP